MAPRSRRRKQERRSEINRGAHNRASSLTLPRNLLQQSLSAYCGECHTSFFRNRAEQRLRIILRSFAGQEVLQARPNSHRDFTESPYAVLNSRTKVCSSRLADELAEGRYRHLGGKQAGMRAKRPAYRVRLLLS